MTSTEPSPIAKRAYSSTRAEDAVPGLERLCQPDFERRIRAHFLPAMNGSNEASPAIVTHHYRPDLSAVLECVLSSGHPWSPSQDVVRTAFSDSILAPTAPRGVGASEPFISGLGDRLTGKTQPVEPRPDRGWS